MTPLLRNIFCMAGLAGIASVVAAATCAVKFLHASESQSKTKLALKKTRPRELLYETDFETALLTRSRSINFMTFEAAKK